MTAPVIGVAVERGGGRKRGVAQPRLDAEAAMHLHGVRALLDAGADAREFLRLLVDLGLDADAAQRRRRREPADAGADDDDRQALVHRVDPQSHPGLRSGGHFMSVPLAVPVVSKRYHGRRAGAPP